MYLLPNILPAGYDKEQKDSDGTADFRLEKLLLGLHQTWRRRVNHNSYEVWLSGYKK
jgi:hypothetical protein